MNEQRKQALIALLQDNAASDGERDDAAIDLSNYDSSDVQEALMATAINDANAEIVKASCGESLAEIWIRKNAFDLNKFSKLKGVAMNEARALIQERKPEWLV